MLCRGVLVGYDEEVASRERFGFWLEKNNEGWGSITILRVNLKSACKTFFLASFLFGGSWRRADFHGRDATWSV